MNGVPIPDGEHSTARGQWKAELVEGMRELIDMGWAEEFTRESDGNRAYRLTQEGIDRIEEVKRGEEEDVSQG